MKLFTKINIGKIVSGHFKTLRNNNTGKLGFDDFLTFFFIPVIGASSLIYFNILLNESATNIIITTLSILVGLLFNVIVIIFDIIKRDSSKKLKNEILNQLLTNISYSIIVSILIIAFALVTSSTNCCVKKTAMWIVYFLIGNYFMTVLMIIKRMYLLFVNELDDIANNTGANRRS